MRSDATSKKALLQAPYSFGLMNTKAGRSDLGDEIRRIIHDPPQLKLKLFIFPKSFCLVTNQQNKTKTT